MTNTKTGYDLRTLGQNGDEKARLAIRLCEKLSVGIYRRKENGVTYTSLRNNEGQTLIDVKDEHTMDKVILAFHRMLYGI